MDPALLGALIGFAILLVVLAAMWYTSTPSRSAPSGSAAGSGT